MENHSYHLIAYAVYLPISCLLTWYVANSLFNSGKVFMLDIFKGRQDISNATNQMFKVGFYLLNLGFALHILEIGQDLSDYRQTIEALSEQLGGFSIYLGLMLFFNLFLFFRGKSKSAEMEKIQKLNSMIS